MFGTSSWILSGNLTIKDVSPGLVEYEFQGKKIQKGGPKCNIYNIKCYKCCTLREEKSQLTYEAGKRKGGGEREVEWRNPAHVGHC